MKFILTLLVVSTCMIWISHANSQSFMDWHCKRQLRKLYFNSRRSYTNFHMQRKICNPYVSLKCRMINLHSCQSLCHDCQKVMFKYFFHKYWSATVMS